MGKFREFYWNQTCYEQRITRFLVEGNTGKTFLMPDGASRQKLGHIGASLVRMEGKIGSLKMQWMGNEKTICLSKALKWKWKINA